MRIERRIEMETIDAVRFIIENEDTIIKDLLARTKYFSLVSVSPSYVKEMTTDYIKDLFNTASQDELLNIIQEPYVNKFINDVSEYLIGGKRVNTN